MVPYRSQNQAPCCCLAPDSWRSGLWPVGDSKDKVPVNQVIPPNRQWLVPRPGGYANHPAFLFWAADFFVKFLKSVADSFATNFTNAASGRLTGLLENLASFVRARE